MCGLAGFVDFAGIVRDPAETLRAMARCLVHRGPDDEGVSFDETTRTGLAFRRLAILDLSPMGRQPMRSSGGRFEIVFNGEIYNHINLRAKLIARGHAFRSRSDTETMLAAFEEWGVSRAIESFSGMFAFAVLDHSERALWLVRDRFGVKPLHYGCTHGRVVAPGSFRISPGTTLVFASELRALRVMPSMQLSVDREALRDFMRFGYVPGPQTIHTEARKLLPGHLLRVDLTEGIVEERVWWRATELNQQCSESHTPSTDAAAIDAVDHTLLESVRTRLVADVPVGAFLSGGVDSTAVVAAMQELSTQRVRTFTIAPTREDLGSAALDESAHARAIAAHLGTEHTELRVSGDDARAIIPSLAELFDEPFADSSQIPAWFVSKLARTQVKVALSGDGGDELFGGYYRHEWVGRIMRLSRGIPVFLRGPLASALGALPAESLNTLGRALARISSRVMPFDRLGERAHKLAPLLRHDDPWQIYQALLSVDPDANSLVLGSTPICGSNHRLSAPDAADPAFWNPSVPLETHLMQADIAGYLVDDILVKVDRTSMAHGLEVREPLLDRSLAVLAFRLPISMKIRDGERKWVLRRVAERRVPAQLLARPKQGFSIPLVGWLRGPLRPWAESLLAEDRIRREGFLDPAAVRMRWDALDHASASTSVAPIWSVLMFQAWLERQSG